MSQVIRIPIEIYKRLESHVKGFDTPGGVIERLLDYYERNHHTDKSIPSNLVANESSFQKSSAKSSFSARRKVYAIHATDRFQRDLENDLYTITSPKGVSKSFKLPSVDDKRAIRELTHSVEQFAKEQGGTIGQIKAARKKLTEFGYHITK